MPPRGSPAPDGGYAQVGCVLALISAPVGAVAGAFVAFVGGYPGDPLVEVTILAASVGFVVGFFVFQWLTEQVFNLVPATRARAAELSMGLSLFIPGLVALLTWLLVAMTGLDDQTQLLWLAGGVIGVAIVGSFVLTGIQATQTLLSRRKGRASDRGVNRTWLIVLAVIVIMFIGGPLLATALLGNR